MPNYCVYATFDSLTESKLTDLSKSVQKKFEKYLKFNVDEFQHITISYGPPKPINDAEILEYDKESITELLGTQFMDELENFDVGTCVDVCKIDIFDRKDLYVVKLALKSNALNNLRQFLYNNMKTHYEQLLKEINDGSFNLDSDKWCHVTIALIDKTNCCDISEILEYANKEYARLLSEKTLKINDIELISAISDKRISLLKK